MTRRSILGSLRWRLALGGAAVLGVLVGHATLPIQAQTAQIQNNNVAMGLINFIDTNRYHNYGTTLGSDGFGIRENAGAMQVKDDGGAWAAIAGGATLDLDTLCFSIANPDVCFSRSAAGTLQIAAVGLVNNEDWTIDLETVADTITWASATGVTNIANPFDFTMGAGARVLLPNLGGSALLPAIAWADVGGVYDTGFLQDTTNTILVSLGGAGRSIFVGTGFQVGSDKGFLWDGTAIPNGGLNRTALWSPATATLAVSNLTTAQTLRVVGTTDSDTAPLNFELIEIGNDGTVGFIRTVTGGTGQADIDLVITTAGTGNVLSSEAGGWALMNETATQSNPTLVPRQNDDNTGVGQNGADSLALVAGGFGILVLREATAATNYVAAVLDAPDQINVTSAAGSTWRLLSTTPNTIDWDGGVTITATDGLGLYLDAQTQTADQATTITTASTLYVSNPIAGSNITITNTYPINTESAAFLTSAGVWTDNPSTREKKHDIFDLDPDLMRRAIATLRPRSWVYNDEWGDEGRTRIGLVAEEQPSYLYGLGTQQRNVTSPSIMAGFALAGLSYQQDRLDGLQAEIDALRVTLAQAN